MVSPLKRIKCKVYTKIYMNLNSNELRFAWEGEMSEVNLDTCVKQAYGHIRAQSKIGKYF